MCEPIVASAVGCFLGLVFSVLAISLPRWSMTSILYRNSPLVMQESSYHAGIWGFCMDVLERNSSNVTTKCFPFHSNSKSFFVTINASEVYFPLASICSLKGHKIHEMVNLSGIPSTERYISTSCSSLGWSSIILASLTPIFAAIALALMIYLLCCIDSTFPTCYEFIAFFLAMSLLCCVSVVTIWTHQSPFGVPFGASFYFEIAAVLALFIALASSCTGYMYDMDRSYTRSYILAYP